MAEATTAKDDPKNWSDNAVEIHEMKTEGGHMTMAERT